MVTVTSPGSGNLQTSYGDAGIDGRASIGDLLRRAREDRGLTLERIALETKIPQRHLEALERGDLTAATVGFYQRAEIRAYARAVGLDTEVALAYLQPTSKPVETRGTRREMTNPGPSTPSRTYGLIALAAVAVVLAAVVLARVSSQPAPSSTIGSEPVSVVPPIVPDRDASPDAAASPANQSDPAAAVAVGADVGSEGATAAPESPAAASSVTELIVTTQPAGARVTVNGIGWGVTPLAIRHVPPGEKRIRVSMDGYTAEERVLRVDQGRQQALDIQLNPAP